jgi:hypothetical protein
MNTYAVGVAAQLTASLPTRTLLILATGAGMFVLLLYVGIALPAVWSAKPARRKAAAEVLRQILAIFRRS